MADEPKRPRPKASATVAGADLPTLVFASPAAFEAWLAEHGASRPGVWLEIAKKDSGVASISYAEAVDVALCFGWIDGHKRAADARCWLQRFTPRTAKSKWSQINRDKAMALIRAGRMRPPGLHQIELAKQDGRWDAAYASPRNAEVPEDLARALAEDARAAAFFATLDSANRYAILYRLHHSKPGPARAAKVAKFIRMLGDAKKLHG